MNFHDSELMTPVHIACQNGNVAMANMLLDYGACVNGTKDAAAMEETVVRTLWDPRRVSLVRLNSWSPLHHACGCGNAALVQLLVANGASVNARECLDL